jgi:hydroxyacylglutathione hydrolase
MFHRIFDEGLAHSSYVIACERTRRGAVVDPRRDVEVYVELARQHGLTLTHAIETHVHADFVSGARELGACGLRTVAGPGAALEFDHDELSDGDTLAIGDITLTALHTPGHTPEHISVLVREPDQVGRVLTGDTLFVSAVGRPDLLGGERARALAGDLYVSLADKLMALPDDVQVHPGHGAGSLCGSGIGSAPFSTIGQERRFNPLLQHRLKEAFVEAVLADLPETPPYFAELKRVNRIGPAVFDLASGVRDVAPLAPVEAERAVRQGAILIDLRQGDAFVNGHAASAISIGFGAKVGYWAGWVVPLSAPVILMNEGDRRQIQEARRQLLRVGIDRVAGYLEGGFAAWRAAELPVGRISQMTAREVHDPHGQRSITVVDVRTRHEYDEGHVAGALHLPVGTLASRTGDVPRDRPVATICEGGYRSVLAASLLARAGFAPIVNVTGGMAAYRALDDVVVSRTERAAAPNHQ